MWLLFSNLQTETRIEHSVVILSPHSRILRSSTRRVPSYETKAPFLCPQQSVIRLYPEIDVYSPLHHHTLLLKRTTGRLISHLLQGFSSCLLPWDYPAGSLYLSSTQYLRGTHGTYPSQPLDLLMLFGTDWQQCPSFYHFLALRYKNSHQHPVLTLTHSVRVLTFKEENTRHTDKVSSLLKTKGK